MPRDNPFLYLRNSSTENDHFKKTRGRDTPEEEEAPPRIPRDFHKNTIRTAYGRFNTEQQERSAARTLTVPYHFDSIKIHFLIRFDQKLERRFLRTYGLKVLSYEDFNKTVLFSIDDIQLFEVFKGHLTNFFESGDTDTYEGTAYAVIALVQDFYFLSSQRREGDYSVALSSFSLVPFMNRQAVNLYKALVTYLESHQKTFYVEPLRSNIEVTQVSAAELKTLLDNFDIIKTVTSSRAMVVRPGAYNEVRREYGFTVEPDPADVLVGIIDTGVESIEPLRPVMSRIGVDLTGAGAPFWDENGHGTMMAGLVALGSDFLQQQRTRYQSKARIAVIKVIQQGTDNYSINELIATIRWMHRDYKIRLFNLSLNDPIPKKYNAAYSDYAYLLDTLAHELGILFFISTGNIQPEHVQALQDQAHPSHRYPFHFYCLGNESDIHSCQATNICAPAESLNNVTVGALADNFRDNYRVGITPAKEYPAYYTRKFHIDFEQKVNGTKLGKNQRSKHLNKPDLVYNGGDLFEQEAGIEVLISPSPRPDGSRYYTKSVGSSIATPLVTSMAAEIARLYSALHVQTIKALLLNSAELSCSAHPHHFSDASHEKLLKKLTGLGTPRQDYMLFTSENEATFVIEDTIQLEHFQSTELHLPAYMARGTNKLSVTATLCYSFEPLRDNHLNYCPLQIVFGIFQGFAASDMADANTGDYRIPKGPSWSEDFFGAENRIYSNVQHLDFYLNAEKLQATENVVSIAVKCTGKKEIDSTYRRRMVQEEHSYALVIRIAEYPENNATGDLYPEIVAINTVEDIIDIDLEADLDAEEEA